MLRLEFPSKKHQQMYEEMIQEWSEVETIPTSPGRLFIGDTYDDFLFQIKNDVVNNQRGVNSTLFFGIDNDKLVGAIHIRHHINHPNLQETGGHIGYGIRPSERRKGYATEILKIALIEVKKLGIDKILISCEPENIASEKVILKNGGIYNKTIKKGECIYKTHWITL